MELTQGQEQFVEKPMKPFSLIFFIEMWERFGYYGMIALLVIFMINKLDFSDSTAYNTYGAFSALCYAFISIGGFIGDKILGTKRTTLVGAIILCAGYMLLTYDPHKTLYWGLATVIVGNMLFKANPSSLVAKLYKKGDPRLDSAFTMYYMSINIGSFISMTLCPIVQEKYGFEPAFTICAFGLGLAIIGYLLFGRLLNNIGSEPDFKPINILHLVYVVAMAAAMICICAWLLKNLTITTIVLALSLVATFGIMIKLIISAQTKNERTHYVVCLVLIVEAIVFFVLYQQMPTSLNLFAIRNTDCIMFGIKVPGPVFQNLNPFWIMLGSPILALAYNALGRKGRDFSIPAKFAFGMLLCAISFLILPFAVQFFSKDNLVAGNWLVASYFFQSIGELLISGLGLSMVTKLVPQKIVGFVMGAWFMSSAVAMSLGGFVASLASVPKEDFNNPAASLHIYSDLFLKLGLTTLIICVIMFLFVPKLKKYMK